jgi:hypothetical protein
LRLAVAAAAQRLAVLAFAALPAAAAAALVYRVSWDVAPSSPWFWAYLHLAAEPDAAAVHLVWQLMQQQQVLQQQQVMVAFAA